MAVSRLIFTPRDSTQHVEPSQLLQQLAQLELIRLPAYRDNHYLPGESFISLITFLGCSPSISLQPDDSDTDDNHCFIAFINTSDQIQCLGYTRQSHPKCPHCRKRIADWKTSDWQQPGAQCRCDKCGTESEYAHLNWKHECGFGRSGFSIANIYPHEAVPTDQLLEKLQQQTGVAWDYAYANNEAEK
jgi:hypothetical protein